MTTYEGLAGYLYFKCLVCGREWRECTPQFVDKHVGKCKGEEKNESKV